MMKKTIKAKIFLDKNQKEQLQRDLDLFCNACNWIAKQAFQNRVFHRIRLHYLTYHKVREIFGLKSCFAITAIRRVGGAYLNKKNRSKLLKFDKNSLDLDDDLFRIFETPEGFFVSLANNEGKRIKAKIGIGKKYVDILRNQKPKFATLKLEKNEFFLHMCFDFEVPVPSGENPVGVDIGLKNMAVVSNGLLFKGGKIIQKRRHFRNVRQSLQRKGTKGAKRLLKRLSGKEARWMRTVNHVISRKIVDSLQKGDMLVLEDLSYILNRIRVRKNQRADFHSWAFGQLQNFLVYKCLEKGILVKFVDARHSSQTCPRCNYQNRKNRRTTSLFRCLKCGLQHNADFVASLNLANRAGSVASGCLPFQPLNRQLRAISLSY